MDRRLDLSKIIELDDIKIAATAFTAVELAELLRIAEQEIHRRNVTSREADILCLEIRVAAAQLKRLKGL